MYILIFEDRGIRWTENITQQELDSANGGYLDIINLLDSSEYIPQLYTSEGWKDIEERKN